MEANKEDTIRLTNQIVKNNGISNKTVKHKKDKIICPICHLPSWQPQKIRLTNKYNKTYEYWQYRHIDKRKKSGVRKCNQKI